MTEIKYAKQDGLHIAYRILGNGPIDLVNVANWVTDIEQMQEVPTIGTFNARVASYARTLLFDQLGTGHSDPIFGDMPSLETFAQSVKVVMDDAGIERAALLAWDLSTPAAIMFAATHPERVSALVIIGGSARIASDDAYPGLDPELLDQTVEAMVGAWGTKAYARFLAPSMAGDEEASEAVARWTRSALSPGMARRVFTMTLQFDGRSLLPSVNCPTLVLRSTRSLASADAAQGQYLVDHIANARLELFDSADHLPYQTDHFEWMMDTIQEFLTGERPPPPSDERVLATVLFADIVGSTERASRLGDRAWRELLERHDGIVRKTIERYRGRYVNSTGDGVLATFDGPARAIRCAREMHTAIGRLGLDIRAGAHTGEIELAGEDVRGMAVHIGARVSAMAGPGEVLVSSTVKDLVVGSGIEFEDRGSHQLKGVPDEWRIYAVKE